MMPCSTLQHDDSHDRDVSGQGESGQRRRLKQGGGLGEHQHPPAIHAIHEHPG
jgi:hypothetical protein